MTTARHEYEEILTALYRDRVRDVLTMQDESRIANDLTELWYKLTPNEQEEIGRLTEQFKRVTGRGTGANYKPEIKTSRRRSLRRRYGSKEVGRAR
jgi:hypothetical protein